MPNKKRDKRVDSRFSFGLAGENGWEDRLLMCIALESLSRGFGLEVISSCRSFGIGAPCRYQCDFASARSMARCPVNCFAASHASPKDLPETVSCTSHSAGDAETFGARAGQSRGRRGCSQGQAGGLSHTRSDVHFMFSSCSVHVQFMMFQYMFHALSMV